MPGRPVGSSIVSPIGSKSCGQVEVRRCRRRSRRRAAGSARRTARAGRSTRRWSAARRSCPAAGCSTTRSSVMVGAVSASVVGASVSSGSVAGGSSIGASVGPVRSPRSMVSCRPMRCRRTSRLPRRAQGRPRRRVCVCRCGVVLTCRHACSSCPTHRRMYGEGPSPGSPVALLRATPHSSVASGRPMKPRGRLSGTRIGRGASRCHQRGRWPGGAVRGTPGVTC